MTASVTTTAMTVSVTTTTTIFGGKHRHDHHHHHNYYFAGTETHTILAESFRRFGRRNYSTSKGLAQKRANTITKLTATYRSDNTASAQTAQECRHLLRIQEDSGTYGRREEVPGTVIALRAVGDRMHLGDPGVDWRIILKWIFKKWYGHGLDWAGSG
jgi:hypothetical protein